MNAYVARNADEFVSIAEIRQGNIVRTRVLISQKDLVPRRNAAEKYFLSLNVMDKTGQIVAKVWENAEGWNDRIQPGDVVEIYAQAKTYNNKLELNVNSMQKVSVADPSEFLPTTKEDRGKMYTQILKWIEDSNHPGLQRLLRYVFEENEETSQAFTEAIGATHNHHAYIGGLLEHTYNVTRIALVSSRIYEYLDRDLLVAGCLLHDIGKLQTYQWKASFERTLDGEMLEHIHLGYGMVLTILREQNIVLDDETRVKLMNMIVSHHGRPEYGSSHPARSPEAFILHQADMIDSTMNRVELALENVQDGWTADRVQMLDRNVTLLVGSDQ